MRVIALRHMVHEDLGSLADALERRRIEFVQLDAPRLSPDEVRALDPELLVVLGGPVSANDTESFPFLSAELELLRARLARARPTLGLCLGAQLMARALGHTVRPLVAPPGNSGKPVKEIGWKPLELTPAGVDAPLALLAGLRVFHWHGEECVLPPVDSPTGGVAHLAMTDLCRAQAFSVGGHGMALQFHPEVRARDLESWYVGGLADLSAIDLDVSDLRAESARLAPALESASAPFWDSLLDWFGLRA